MSAQLVLIRGINVGGKNTISMATLRSGLEELGCTNVQTVLNSGNALVDSSLSPSKLAALIEEDLPKRFHLDDEAVRVLAMTHRQLDEVVTDRPRGFGAQPDTYHSDAIFLMGISVAEAMKVFDPREGVDQVWPGKGVVYSQRLSAERTKSKLSKIIGTPAYKSMTIRSWSTTLKLQKALAARASE